MHAKDIAETSHAAKMHGRNRNTIPMAQPTGQFSTIIPRLGYIIPGKNSPPKKKFLAIVLGQLYRPNVLPTAGQTALEKCTLNNLAPFQPNFPQTLPVSS